MNREQVFQSLADIDDRFVAEAIRYAPGATADSPGRIVHMKKKRLFSLALAAALILALGAVAYAAWSIHAARQHEIKTDLKIEENSVESYVEYAVPEAGTDGLVLLSAFNDGTEEHVYVNISPVTEKDMAAFPENMRFAWSIPGTQIGGFAGPELPSDLNISGAEAIREAVKKYAWDESAQTMTLQCYLDVKIIRTAMDQLGAQSVPLQVHMIVGDNEPQTFGPVTFSLTDEETRYFDFGRAVYHDAELDRDIEIVGLELTPFSAVWKVHYEGDASFHTPEADWDAYAPWSQLEDKVCIESKLWFSDGTSFSTGGALTTPYENGTVNQYCGWGSAINIRDIRRITLGDLVLWEAE